MLFCMALTSKNVSKLQQKLHFSKRNEKTINICSKPFIKIYSIDYIISKVISYLFDSHNSDFIPLKSQHLLVKEQRKRGLWKVKFPISRVLVLNLSPISAVPQLVRCPKNPKTALMRDLLYYDYWKYWK